MTARLRVVSLVPSSTETLLALGADVVACTRFCEQPELLHVGGTKNPDVDAIIRMAPDLVVMDREENRREDFEALRASGLTLYVSDVRTVADALKLVTDLAGRIGAVDVVLDEPLQPPRSAPERGTVFVPIWRRPWMSIGAETYGSSMLRRLGWSVLPFGDVAYPTIELAEVAVLAPALVVVPSEPYEFTDVHLEELGDALGDTPIVPVDGRDLFWWGIRTPSAIGRLAATLSGAA